jgi:patatin-like phospholipase/acyl hydrolase
MKLFFASLLVFIASSSYAMDPPVIVSKFNSKYRKNIEISLNVIKETIKEYELSNACRIFDGTLLQEIDATLNKKSNKLTQKDMENIEKIKQFFQEKKPKEKYRGMLKFLNSIYDNIIPDFLCDYLSAEDVDFLSRYLNTYEDFLNETNLNNFEKEFLNKIEKLNENIALLTRPRLNQKVASVSMLPFFNGNKNRKNLAYKYLSLPLNQKNNVLSESFSFLWPEDSAHKRNVILSTFYLLKENVRPADTLSTYEMLLILLHLEQSLSEYNPLHLKKTSASDKYRPVQKLERPEIIVRESLKLVRELKQLTLKGIYYSHPQRLNYAIKMIEENRAQEIKRYEDFRNKKEVWVLSIDGGGIKGLFSAVLLDKLEQLTGLRVHEIFDYIAGTSTGSLLALGLTVPAEENPEKPKYDIKFIRNIYEKDGATIFPPQHKIIKTMNSIVSYRYEPEPLEAKLQNYFNNYDLSAALIPVLVPTFSISQKKTVLLSSLRPFKNDGQGAVKFWQAARASSAAPTFFPPYTMNYNGHSNVFVDGGLTNNNPTYVALRKIKKLCPKLEKIVILSLGTKNEKEELTFAESDTGIQAAVEQLRMANSDHARRNEKNAREIIAHLDNHYFRIVGKTSEVKMDDPSDANIQNLIKIAEQAALSDVNFKNFVAQVREKKNF